MHFIKLDSYCIININIAFVHNLLNNLIKQFFKKINNSE